MLKSNLIEIQSNKAQTTLACEFITSALSSNRSLERALSDCDDYRYLYKYITVNCAQLTVTSNSIEFVRKHSYLHIEE